MKILLISFLLCFALNFAQTAPSKYILNEKRITKIGTNAEAYWSFDDKKLIFQAIREGDGCDQIYSMNADGTDIKKIGNGKGRTTCSFFYPDGKHFVYGSTMDTMGKGCPPTPDRVFGYVWPIYKTMDIYLAKWPSGEIVKKLTNSGSYDAEATLSPLGDKMVFTSTRSGDLELYSMALNGTNVKRLTFTPGYDGGAFYSNDGKKIVWRANRPKGAALSDYLNLLSLGIVEPVTLPMEIYTMNADGSKQTRITNIGGASFAPYFLPNDDGIIFSSNGGKNGPFNLYACNLAGDKIVQLTDTGTFNSFPMFSRDGKKLVYESTKYANAKWGGIDIVIADWVDIDWKDPNLKLYTYTPPTKQASILDANNLIILLLSIIAVTMVILAMTSCYSITLLKKTNRSSTPAVSMEMKEEEDDLMIN